MIPGGSAQFLSRAAACVFAVTAVGMLWQVFAHVTQPGDFVVKHLVLDDAVYYAVPARKFVDGLGYSFDGLHRTNGVQPLWAAIVTLLAFFVRDDLTLLRASAAVSGTTWLLAGVLLFRFLRPYGAFAGLAAIGFLTAGVEMRLGLSGMENGVQATLLMLLLHRWRDLEATSATDAAWRSRALRCGVLLALLCLNRVEFPVLAIPFGLRALVLRRRSEPWTQAAWSLRPLVLPAVLAVVAWGVTSRIYFGDWTPVSGSVKAHMTATTPDLPGFLPSYGHHVVQVLGISFLPSLMRGIDWSARALSLGADTAVGLTVGLFCLPLFTGLVPFLAGLRRGTARLASWPVVLLGLAAVVHLALVSKYLRMFTSYCTWYFAVDVLAVWALLGIALGSAKGRLARLACVPALLMILVTGAQRLVFGGAPPDYPLSATGSYVEAGRLAQRWLPPGRRLGAFNAGFISFHAKSHTVVNLDGLMNDGTYLREYFSKNRLPEYVHDTGLEYLVDCLPIHLWQSYDLGTTIRMPKDMRIVQCDPAEDGWLTCILATPEAGKHGANPAPSHPLAAFHWDAIVRGRHALVRTADLATLGPDREVVSTVLEPGSRAPLHLVADRAIARTALDVGGFAQLPPFDLDFGGKVALVAAEVPPGPQRRGSTILVRTYWRAEALGDGDRLEFGLLVGSEGTGSGPEAQWHAPAHGTLPATAWPRGAVIAHTFAVRIPDDARGPLAVAIAVKNGGAALPAATRGDGPVRIGAIEVAAR